MDYTKVPRILLYKERTSLEEFGVYDADTFNRLLYNSLMRLDDLKPRYQGVFQEILRLLNDAYYYLTQIFLEKNPLERYAIYCNEAGVFPPDYDFDWDGESRELVIKCMLYDMLRTFGKSLTAPQQDLLKAIADDINEYHKRSDVGTILGRLRGEAENIAYKLTCDFQSNSMPNSISKEYFTRRDIQEVIDSKYSLESCLCAGADISDAVSVLCKNKGQKLALIERLLEPEKQHYGVMDSKVTAAYRSLYELRAQLTGETLPDELPFEKVATSSPPLAPTYSHDITKVSMSNDENDAAKLLKDMQSHIEELEEQVTHYHNMEKGIALGLNQGQSSLFVKSLANTFGFDFTNQKKDLAPLAHGLFGWGESKLAKCMSTPCDKEKRDELANLFKDICPELYATIMNWGDPTKEETPKETPS